MNREDLIRERAHAIWEAEGCPDGRDDQHWRQATLDIEEAEGEATRAPEPADLPEPVSAMMLPPAVDRLPDPPIRPAGKPRQSRPAKN